MSIEKAKMYQTARISKQAGELPEGFYAGEYVAVRYIGRGAFGLNFQVAHSRAFELAAVLSENDLENFVL